MNLQYQVLDKKKKSVMNEIVEKINGEYRRMAGILYCLSRKECDTCAAHLNSENIRAKAYHAGMTDKLRNNVQAEWLSNKIQVLLTTFAKSSG